MATVNDLVAVSADLKRAEADNARLRAALLLAQAFMPTVRREMPHQANLIDAHKVVADALEALHAHEQSNAQVAGPVLTIDDVPSCGSENDYGAHKR